MTTVINIQYGGHALESKLVKHLIAKGIEKNVPPSLFISQLYYESNWGNSNVAKLNNNWGGLTWSGSTQRPSGIVVSRGTARPSNEGGYYMKFASVEDYLTDYIYLITDQGIYNIQNKSSFEESVRGLFKVGGAKYDYAEVGATQYVATMKSIRNGINNNNNDFLTKIDSNPSDYVDGSVPDPDPDPEPEPEPDPELNVDEFIQALKKIFGVNLFDYSKNFKGNNYFKLTQTFENTYNLKASDLFYTKIKDLLSYFTVTPDPQPDPDPDPDPDPEPEPSGKKYFPVNPKASGVNFWTPPHDIPLKANMDYGGERSGRRHWAYDIGAGGNTNISCHAVVDGEVLSVNADNLGTVVIKNSADKYWTQYMHLKLGAFTVKKGDKVKAGQKIGIVGGTGGYDIHLHFAVSVNGTFGTEKDTIDPKPYLKVTGNNKTDLPSPN